MRIVVLSTLIALPLLAACASNGQNSTYKTDYDRLDADCTARGGILTPTGAQTGRPQTEYACRITGGASRIPAI
ncbi:hypothetical protein [Brevundimonas sp.]|uniref:hypothetical protein n=1 Tax=Brevundimonas sp. TaxID=1871086 RepID=UPI001811CCDC|nr:hypothetical protein [Brevundimonas sp.]MBA4808406.1 hypothetical protein [Brevundimonas sp.]